MPVEPLVLPAGECHVWWARPTDGPADLRRLLDADERARGERLVLAADRLRFLAAHALARLVLARYLGYDAARLRFTARCTACGQPHGKPRLADPPADLELSLSHSGERVVVAIARAVPVGVDVEQVGTEDHRELVEDVLAPGERRALRELGPTRRRSAFLRYWVRKEALLKATGDGLTVSPALVTVSAPDQPARLLAWEARQAAPVHAQLIDLDPGEGLVACVALLAEARHRVVEHDGAVLLKGARAQW